MVASSTTGAATVRLTVSDNGTKRPPTPEITSVPAVATKPPQARPVASSAFGSGS